MPNKEVEKDIDKYGAIQNLAESDGGKILKEQLENDIDDLVDALVNKYKTEEPIKLIPVIAKIDSKLEILEKFKSAEYDKNLAIESLKTAEKGQE